MNRRQFFLATLSTAAAIAVPELWVPKRTIFLPPRGGWPSSKIAVVDASYLAQPSSPIESLLQEMRRSYREVFPTISPAAQQYLEACAQYVHMGGFARVEDIRDHVFHRSGATCIRAHEAPEWFRRLEA